MSYKSDIIKTSDKLDEFNNFITLAKEDVVDFMKTERYLDAWRYIEEQLASNQPIGDSLRI